MIEQFLINKLRACDSPLHIEAREKNSKMDWISSKYKLIHDISTDKLTPKWRFGLSKNYGYVLTNINQN